MKKKVQAKEVEVDPKVELFMTVFGRVLLILIVYWIGSSLNTSWYVLSIIVLFIVFFTPINRYFKKRNAVSHVKTKSPYPDLFSFELAVYEAVRDKKKEFTVDLFGLELTREKVDYLERTYGLVFPAAHPGHLFHERYLKMYKELENDILEGKMLIMYKYEAEYLQSFVDRNHPGVVLLYKEPTKFRFPVSGLKYYDYKKKEVKAILDFIDLPESVDLVPDPDNEYDSYAVEIHFKEFKLGYVARSHSKKVFEAIEKGVDIEADMVYYSPTGLVAERLEVEIIIYN